jgi:hypothetical protein
VAALPHVGGSPRVHAPTLDRRAGQVERLAQRASGSSEVVDALELLIAEHLEVLRDEIEGRVSALGPMLQEELEAVRTEAVAGVGATEEALAERLVALETGVLERLDAALAEQLDGLDALLHERLVATVGELAAGLDGRLDDLAAATAAVETGVGEQLSAVTTALAELQEVQAGAAGDDDGAEVAAALASISEEVQALRRRITLRADGGDDGAALSDGQLDALADRIAARLRRAEADADDGPDETMPVPRHAASRGATRRPIRATKRS